MDANPPHFLYTSVVETLECSGGSDENEGNVSAFSDTLILLRRSRR